MDVGAGAGGVDSPSLPSMSVLAANAEPVVENTRAVIEMTIEGVMRLRLLG